MYTEVNENNFEEEVLRSEKPVIVDFWAEWCGPCRMMAPVIEEISEEREDIKVCKVNVDECDGLAAEYSVSAIPTVMMFKDGKAIATAVGYMEKDRLLEKLGV